MSKKFSNTGVLMRFIMRLDRIRLPVWILGITIFTLSTAALLPNMYPAEADKLIVAETMGNPAITFMLGPSAGLDNYTDAAMMGHFMLVFTAIFVAIMSILLVTKHTREDEEEGRAEMINSLPVGSLSNLTATFFILLIANALISLLVAFGLYSLGIETMDLSGSFLYGVSIGTIGIFYAALTGFFAQLTSNVRATLGLSFFFLIGEYLLMGLGDVGNEMLAHMSPLGLIARTQVYVNNLWWPVLILLIASGIIFALSLYLNSIRDLGAGFVSTKPGKRHASRFLASPLGLALRLERTSIISWTIGMFILGIAYGSLLGDLEGFLATSELVQQMIPNIEGMNLTQSFVTMLITIISIIGTIPVVMFALKLSSEEKKNRIGQLLAYPVSRNRIITSYTVISLIASLIMQLVSILGLWSAATFVMDDLISFEVLFKAAFVNLPAIWIFVGIAVFLIGWFPRLTSLTWAYLIYAFFIDYMGEILKVPNWMGKLSPFTHIPSVPAEDITISTLVIVAAIAFLLIGIGFIGYNKRDIE